MLPTRTPRSASTGFGSSSLMESELPESARLKLKPHAYTSPSSVSATVCIRPAETLLIRMLCSASARLGEG
jgi:hypothetical protein